MSIASIATAASVAIANIGKTISNELEYTLKSEIITLAFDEQKDYTLATLYTAIGIPANELDTTTLTATALVETSVANTYVNSQGVVEVFTTATLITVKNKYPDPVNIKVLITIKRNKIL